MKKLMKKLEDLMVAVTFAEAGEYDESKRISEESMQEEESAKALNFKKPLVENAGK